MENPHSRKSLAHTMVQAIEYEDNATTGRPTMKKTTGSASIISFDDGEGLGEKTSPFDTFVQVIDGIAEIVIGSKSNILKTGDGIVIPANISSYIKPNGRFKMLAIIAKSGD